VREMTQTTKVNLGQKTRAFSCAPYHDPFRPAQVGPSTSDLTMAKGDAERADLPGWRSVRETKWDFVIGFSRFSATQLTSVERIGRAVPVCAPGASASFVRSKTPCSWVRASRAPTWRRTCRRRSRRRAGSSAPGEVRVSSHGLARGADRSSRRASFSPRSRFSARGPGWPARPRRAGKCRIGFSVHRVTISVSFTTDNGRRTTDKRPRSWRRPGWRYRNLALNFCNVLHTIYAISPFSLMHLFQFSHAT
jgi:hypothetical protein